MITVLQIISDTNLGGAGRVLFNYLANSDKTSFQTHVAVPQGSVLVPLYEELGATVHQITGMADRSYHKGDVHALETLLETLKPDLIHTHGAFSGRVAGKKKNIPVVFSRHSVFPVSWKKKIPPIQWVNGALNCHYSDGIIAVSPAAEDNLVELGVPRKKITVIFNGVSPVTKTDLQAQVALKSQLNLPSDVFLFGILARLETYKGHRLLLEACQSLKQQGKSFRVLVAGTGEEAENLKSYAKTLEVEDVVQFLGFWKNVPGLLSILDAQLNCSYGTEATSLSLLEGMSMGLPAIVSDYGGNPSVIRHGHNGLVFPSLQKNQLEETMTRLMEDKPLQETLSQGSKQIFQETFTGEAFAKNTEDFYRTILNQQKRGTADGSN